MMTSSNGNIFRITGPLRGEFTGPGEFPAQSQWRRTLVFSLIYAWINGWVNNREAGHLRRHRAHYDVIVMNYGKVMDDTEMPPTVSYRCAVPCSPWLYHWVSLMLVKQAYHGARRRINTTSKWAISIIGCHEPMKGRTTDRHGQYNLRQHTNSKSNLSLLVEIRKYWCKLVIEVYR